MGVFLKEEDLVGRRDGLCFVNIQIGKERRGVGVQLADVNLSFSSCESQP